MKKRNHASKILGLFLVLLFSLAGCSSPEVQEDADEAASESSSSEVAKEIPQTVEVEYSGEYEYTAEDLDDSWDEAGATKITLNGSSAEIDGGGAKADGALVTISSSGTYILSGTLEDGQILVEATKNDLVRLVLNGVTLSNSKSAPIYAKKAGKTVLVLAEGTENTVTDAESYVYESEDEDEPDAAVFAKDDLTINGSGSLTVNGRYRNGIGSKDYLVITGGRIYVTAVNDGLCGRDGIAILTGNISVNAENDGLKTNNDTDESKGFIVIDGGTFEINSGHDGIQAETMLSIHDGLFTIFTGGGSANAPQQSSQTPWGGGQTDDEDSDSMKGLKATVQINITGGEFDIDSEDDAVHSNGSISMAGGTFDISTGDDGFHADEALVIDDGIIRINTSYEGLEGSTIDINGGEITIRATDDGINAAGGKDGSGGMGRGWDSFSAGGDYYIRITGGNLVINADGDGIDSNRDLYIEGGTIYISGPTGNMDGSLDADGTFEINGGFVIAAGSSGMVELPENSSAQPTLAVYYTSTQEAGRLIRLLDSSGQSVAEYSPEKYYQSVVISTPELTVGETYSLYSDDTFLGEITLTDTVTTVAEDGSAVSGRGMGGPGGGFSGGGGGRQQPSDSGERPEMPDGEPPEGMPEGDGPGGGPGGGGEQPELPAQP